MPKYDYYCEANGQVIEVSHSMHEKINTWSELCSRLGLAVGETPAESPVRKLITGTSVVHATSLKNPERPPCQSGAPCCGANRCDFS